MIFVEPTYTLNLESKQQADTRVNNSTAQMHITINYTYLKATVSRLGKWEDKITVVFRKYNSCQ